MGKKQHSKDRLYITSTEWKTEWGGKKEAEKTAYSKLPFSCCALSFSPWEDPVCTQDGIVFDILNIVPYIRKYGKHPVSGEPVTLKDLIKLTFHKNAEGEYHCPITYKVFSEHSHIVAVKTSGQVYSYDAVDELNIKPRHWKDLVTDEPFTRKDIIVIQDPKNPVKRCADDFYHVKEGQRLAEEEEKARNDPTYGIQVSGTMGRILKELRETDVYKGGGGGVHPESSTSDPSKDLPGSKAPQKMHFSNGMMAASFTSTARSVVTVSEAALKPDQGRCPNKKGYVRVVTSHGDLNIELHCDMVPRTCENFITLCERGYYDNVAFHRSIKNFMIQGGDPTGTGKGGASIWGKEFADEFRPQLSHSGRGIVSMANAGPNTNGSQFFILYKSARHLDNKHTVFGKIVGGMQTLTNMEKIPTDDDDKPLEPIVIKSTQTFVNPYTEPDEADLKKLEDEKRKKEIEEDVRGEWFSNPVAATPAATRSGVGKYLPTSLLALSSDPLASTSDPNTTTTGSASSDADAGVSSEDPLLLPPAKRRLEDSELAAEGKTYAARGDKGWGLKTRTSNEFGNKKEYGNFSDW